MNKLKILRTTQAKIAIFTVSTLIASILLFIAFKSVVLYFENNTIRFNRVVDASVKFNPILTVEKREPVRIVEYVGQEELDKLVSESENPDIVSYILEKWGPVEGIKAVAIAKAESGLREDAINLNNGSSLDVGVFQVNFHFHGKKPGCSLKELTDAYSNIDCAYSIWQAQGWNPWVAYTTNSYLAHLK